METRVHYGAPQPLPPLLGFNGSDVVKLQPGLGNHKNILEKSVRSILRGFPHNPVQESCLNLSFSCKTVHSWCSLHFRKKQIKKCSFIFYSRMCGNGLENRSQREAYVVHLWLCSSKTFLIQINRFIYKYSYKFRQTISITMYQKFLRGYSLYINKFPRISANLRC